MRQYGTVIKTIFLSFVFLFGFFFFGSVQAQSQVAQQPGNWTCGSDCTSNSDCVQGAYCNTSIGVCAVHIGKSCTSNADCYGSVTVASYEYNNYNYSWLNASENIVCNITGGYCTVQDGGSNGSINDLPCECGNLYQEPEAGEECELGFNQCDSSCQCNPGYYDDPSTNNCWASSYTLTFDPTPGGSVTPTSKTVTYNQPYGTLPTPTKAGFTFNRWMDVGDATVDSSTLHIVPSDDTIYAEFMCLITWDGNSGNGHNPSSQLNGCITVDTLPTTDPTRAGYIFNGWRTAPSGGSQVTIGTPVTSNVTYYAQWLPLTPLVNSLTVNYGSKSVTCDADNYDELLVHLSHNESCIEGSYGGSTYPQITSGSDTLGPVFDINNASMQAILSANKGDSVSVACVADNQYFSPDEGSCEILYIDCNGDWFASQGDGGYDGPGDSCIDGGNPGLFDNSCICVPLPTISIDDPAEYEGNTLIFTISLDSPATQPVSFFVDFNYSSDATPGVDFDDNVLSRLGSINIGDQEYTISIPLFNDNIYEESEYILLDISGVIGANEGDLNGNGEIINITPTPVVSIQNATGIEGSSLSFSVVLSYQSVYNTVVRVSTQNGTAGGSDFTPQVLNTVTLPAFTTSANHLVSTLQDTLQESTESFRLIPVSIQQGIANLGSSGTGFILDNDPLCGSGMLQLYYRPQAPVTGDLCSHGVATVPVYTSGVGWTWGCSLNGSSVSCSATERFCGDGFVGTGIGYRGQEQCDDGNGNSGDGCDSSCQLELPVCLDFNFVINPNSGTEPLSVTGTFEQVSGFTITELNWGTGLPISNPTSPQFYTYSSGGLYTGYISIENTLSGSYSISCNANITVSNMPLTGACDNFVQDEIFYYPDEPNRYNLCSVGSSTGYTYQSGTGWTWTCLGVNSGNSTNCNAIESYCGDGLIGTGIGYISGSELCDDGNSIDNDSCNNSCQPTSGMQLCNFSYQGLVTAPGWLNITGMTGEQRDVLPGSGFVLPLGDGFYSICNGTGVSPQMDIMVSDVSGAFSGGIFDYVQAVTGQCLPQGFDQNGINIDITFQAYVSGNAYYIQTCSDGCFYDPLIISCEGGVGPCGDGILNSSEECDGEEGCDGSCQRVAPSCSNVSVNRDPVSPYSGGTSTGSFSTSQTGVSFSGGAVINIPIVGGTNTGSVMIVNSGGIATCYGTITGGYCGDGLVNGIAGEQCDDGNTNNDDACNNSCIYNIGDPILYPLDPQDYVCGECQNDNECAVGMVCRNSICLPRLFAPCTTSAECYQGVISPNQVLSPAAMPSGADVSYTTIAASTIMYCAVNSQCALSGYVGLVRSGNANIDLCNCGNGLVEQGTTEQCEDGNVSNGDGCTSACNRETPQCSAFNFTINPSAGSAPLSVTGTFSTVTGFTVTQLSRGSGSPISNPTSPQTNTYGSNGLYTGTLTVVNAGSGSLSSVCSLGVLVSSAPIDGECDPFVFGENFYIPADEPINYTLCAVGVATGYTYQAGTGWTWDCVGLNSGATVVCDAFDSYCGDGLIGTGIGYVFGSEQCDDGNSIDNDMCNNSCQRVAPSCSNVSVNRDPVSPYSGGTSTGSFSTSQTGVSFSGGAVINIPIVGGTNTGSVMIVNSGGIATCYGTITGGYCGDGLVNGIAGEQCDDGNTNNDDACNNSCIYNIGDPILYPLDPQDYVCGECQNDNECAVGMVCRNSICLPRLFAPCTTSAECYQGVISPNQVLSPAAMPSGADVSYTTIAASTIMYCAVNSQCALSGYVGLVRSGNANIDLCNCGNGLVEQGTTEQCEDGNVSNGDGCTSACNRETPQCSAFNFTINPSAGSAPLSVTGTFSTVTGFTVTQLSRGSGSPISNPTSPQTNTYGSNGLYTGTLTVVNAGSGSLSSVCSLGVLVSSAPIDGECDPFVFGENFYIPADEPINYTLCAVGVATGYTYQAGTGWTWDCVGENGGADVSCDAFDSYCGDGVIGTGVGYGGNEQCDDGNVLNGDGCSSTCQLECTVTISGNAPLTCNDGEVALTASGANNYVWSNGATGSIILVTGTGTYTVTGTTLSGCIASDEVTVTGTITNLTATRTGTNTSACGVADGTVTVVGSPMSTGLEYQLSGGAWQGTGNFTGLAAGVYTVNVRDVSNQWCDETSVIVTVSDGNSDLPPITITGTTQLTCQIQSTLLSVEGAGGGWTYVWSNGSTGFELPVTGAGVYGVTVSSGACVGVDTIEVFDTCDIQVDKRILGSGEYVGAGGFSYPQNVSEGTTQTNASGSVMSGDWYVYRIEVTNNGLGTATGIQITDLIPGQLTVFQVENNGFDSVYREPNYVSGYIASLVQNGSVFADVWIQSSGIGNVCNEANVQLTSRSDTQLGNNSEQSCVDIAACVGLQTCAGEIYGRDFSASNDGTIWTSDVTCIVEASCGYAGEYSGTAASLTYGSIPGLLPSDTISVPLELGGGTTGMTYGSLGALATMLLDEDTNNGDTFINYELVGNTLFYRVGRHRAECRVPNCAGDLLRTYVSAGGDTWSDIGSLAVANQSTTDGQPVIASEDVNNHTTSGQCTCEGCAPGEELIGGSCCVDGNNNGICDGDEGGDCTGFGITISGNAPLSCGTGSVILTASGGTSYSWSNGGTGASIVVNGTGTYTVFGTGAGGCTGSAQVTVIGNITNLTATRTGTNTSACGVADGTVTVVGSPMSTGLEYQLSGGAWQGTGYFTGLAAGVYTVNVRDMSNQWCGQTSVMVTISDGNSSLPAITITGTTQLTCQTTSTLLSVEGAGGWTYVWSNGSTGFELPVTGAGIYGVTVSSGSCMGSNTIEVFDTCDIQVDKRILGSGEYVGAGGFSYPQNVSEGTTQTNASGSVMSGDWYVYRIEVTNNGLGTATGIQITDLIPGQLTVFQVENNGFDSVYREPNYVSGYIASLVQNGSVFADVWIQSSGIGNVCNEANVQLTSRSDTQLGNNSEQSCVDIAACVGLQTCAGEIYGRDFSASNDGTIWTSDVTCIVEASCGYAGEYSGTAASLTYGSIPGLLPSDTISVPLELGGGTTGMTYGSLGALATMLLDEDTNNGDTFINYELVGNTLFYRVGRHRAECRVPNCAGDLLRTYVSAGGDTWSDIGSLAVANQSTTDGQPVIASEDVNNHTTSGQCTCEGCAPGEELIGGSCCVDGNNNGICDGDEGGDCTGFGITISGNAPLSCGTGSVILTASGGTSYSWSNGGTGASIVVNGTGTYTVFGTGAGGCTGSAQVTVIGNITNLTATRTGTNTSACGVADGTVTVVGSPMSTGLEYQLSGGAWQGTGYFTGLAAGVYTVNVRDMSNQWCGQTSVMVTISDGNSSLPAITITGTTQLTCQTTSTLLSVEGAGGWTYVWSNGSTGFELPVTGAGIYGVTVSSGSCMGSNTIEVFDTCDIQVDKRILGSGEYVGAGGFSYPQNVSEGTTQTNASGSVMSGDWYVYRIEVTNNGLGTATGIQITDLIPGQLTVFQVENNGFDSVYREPNYVSGYIASLVQNGSVFADVWIQSSGIGNVCNEANVQLTSRSDTQLGNNSEQSCVDIAACVGLQTCAGEIYGRDFSASNDGTIWTSDVTCIVEASCGYAGEYSGTAASLTYGSIPGLLPSDTISVPLELGGGTTGMTYGSLGALATMLLDEDTNNGDTFINYELVGNTLFYRVGRHRAECRVPNCAGDLLRTYVSAGGDTWSDIGSLAVANQSTTDGQPVIASEDVNNHTTSGQCTCEGCAPGEELIGGSCCVDGNNNGICDGDEGGDCTGFGITISGNAPLSCGTGSVILTASGGTSYSWSNGGTGASIVVNGTGTYTVFGTGAGGCTGSAQVTVIGNITNLTATRTGTNTSACGVADGTVTVVGSPMSTGLEYQLSGGAWQGTGYFTGLAAGVYTVNVRDMSNQWCGQTSVMVTISDGNSSLPAITITGTTQLTCQTTSTLLSVEGAGGWTYVWSNGSTGFELPVTGAGIYGVTVSSGSCMGSNTIEVFDTCDIQVDKRILGSGEYVGAGGFSYPQNVSEGTTQTNASGSVMSGDWYVYRIEVTNNGLGTATGIQITDLIPGQLTVFQVENNGFDSVYREPNYVSGYIASLVQNGSVFADVWIQSSGIGNVCNEANVQLTSRSDTQLGNNSEQSCVDIAACVGLQTCAGEIYGRDFSASNDGTIWTSDVTCIVEASCGYAGEYSGTAASLTYGSIPGLLPSDTISVPLELGGGTTGMTYGSLGALATMLLDEDTNNGDTFINYELVGNTLFYRVGRHRAECRVPNCAGDLLRTYVPAGGDTWSDIGSLAVANQSTTDGQPVIASEDVNNHTTSGQCTCEGCAPGEELIGGSCCVDGNNNGICDGDEGGDCTGFGITISGNAPLSCGTGSVILTASGGTSYSWSNGGTGASIVVNGTGTYTVFGTGAGGCTGSAQVTVIGNITNLTATRTGTNTSACGVADGTVTVVGSPMSTGLEYQLSGGAWQGTGYFTGLAAGVYTVNVRDMSNQWCGQTSVMVTISDGNSSLPAITITGTTQLTCQTTSTLLSVEGAGGWTYVWSNGSTGFELPVTGAGIYGVTVSSGTCIGAASIEIIDTCFPIDCSPDNLCNPSCLLGTDPDCGGIFSKSLLGYSGNTIQYQITGTIQSGGTLALVDTLSSGAQFTGVIQVNTIIGSGSFGVVSSGNMVLFQGTNQGTGVWQYQILYSVYYTYVSIPNPVCNSIQQVSGSVVFGTGSTTCSCPDGRDYCVNGNRCVPDGTSCTDPNPTGPYCTDLNVSIIPSGTGIQYQCLGSGSNYQVTVSNSSGQVIATGTNATGSFALVNSGTYNVVCAVQGDTGVHCGGNPISCNQVFASTTTIGSILALQSPYFAQVAWTGMLQTNPCTGYIDLSLSGLITELSVDMTAHFISTMITLYGPIPNVPITNGVVTSSTQNIQTAVSQTIGSSCQETCRDIVNFGGYCGNGIVEAGETCDGTPGCRSNCTRTSGPPGGICGNGIINPGETCDQGTGNTTTCTIPVGLNECTYCSTTCKLETIKIIIDDFGYCGDGKINSRSREQCDEGSKNTTTCTIKSGENSCSYCSTSCIIKYIGSSTTGDTTPGPTTPGPTTPGPTTPGPTTPGPTTPGPTTPGDTTPGGSTGGPSGGGHKAPYTDDGTCTKSGVFDPKYCVKTEPKCAEVDPPSIMIGEYLPYRWDLEMGNEIDETASSCGELEAGKFIPGGSVLCTFELYNGASQKSPIHVINNVPCFDDKRNMSGVTLFDEMKGGGSAGRLGSNRLMMSKELTRGIVGEYQIVLSRIDYTVCNDKTPQSKTFRGTTLDRVCAMNFAVSDPYLLHQGTIFSVLQETNLRAYRKVDGRAILSKETMRNLQQSVMARYPNTNIGVIMGGWLEKQNNRAVQQASLSQLTSAFFRKVPTDPIYIYDGGVSREPLIIRGSSNILSPITVIVYNADLIIEGSLKGKHMYLVPDGKILFASNNCDERDVVEGIFMTNKGVLTNKIRNDNLQAKNRCEDGRLLIEGILVSPNIDRTFIESRRGNLDEWFDITTESQEQKVYESASILLRSTPREWKILPPGANSLLRSILLGVTGSK